MTSVRITATMRRLCADPTAAVIAESGFGVYSKTIVYYVIVGCSIIGRYDKEDHKYGGAERRCT